MMYMLKRDFITDEPAALLRIGDNGHQEIWSLTGWEPWSDMSWTGIGGSVDWDEVDEEEARAAIVEMSGDPASLDTAEDRAQRFMQKYR